MSYRPIFHLEDVLIGLRVLFVFLRKGLCERAVHEEDWIHKVVQVFEQRSKRQKDYWGDQGQDYGEDIVPELGRLCFTQVGRWNRTGREEHHQAIDEEPESAEDITRLHAHLGERSDKAEQQEDLFRIKIIASEQKRPHNEHGYEYNHAVEQDCMQIICRGRDKCLPYLRSKGRGQVCHGNCDGLFEKSQSSGKEYELYSPVQRDIPNVAADRLSESIH